MDPLLYNKTNQEMNYFIAGPDKNANMVASAKTAKELHSKYDDVFFYWVH